MRKEIEKYQASLLSLDEQHGMLYLSTSNVKALNFPQCDTTIAVNSYAHSRAMVSPQGEYVSFETERGGIVVYQTANLGEKLFQKNGRIILFVAILYFGAKTSNFLFRYRIKFMRLNSKIH